jgi:hypothetical protein
MAYIFACIDTQKDICNADIAQAFLENLEDKGLSPQKIGLYEPLREPYNKERAIEMWTKEEPGCFIEGVGMIGQAGGMIGNLKESKFRFDLQWWKHPHKKMMNYILFYMYQNSFTKKKNELLALFKETVTLFDAVYGYITHETPRWRQHVAGTLETMLPGVFWCNYFGEKYVEFFGREKLLKYSWHKIEATSSNGVITYLTENPHKELLESNELEMAAQSYLGSEAFGDIEEFKRNPSNEQFRKVPDFS